MSNPNFIAAQGDVLLVQRAAIPAAATAVPPESGRLVLAHGEATGHHHSFALSRGVALFREDGTGSTGPLYLRVEDAPADLTHQEHSTIAVPPGCYRVVRQRTYVAGLARRVAD